MKPKRPADRLGPAEWLLTEATRRQEEQVGEFIIDDAATRAAAAVDAPPARQLHERARRKSGATKLADPIAHWLGLVRLTLIAIPALGLLAGVSAAGLVETRPGVIALSYALVALLLIPTLMLMLWLALSLSSPSAATRPGLAGRAAWAGLLGFGRRLIPMPAPLRSCLAVLARQHGRTVAALATHGFWCGFFVGAIAWLALKFIGLRFDFSWETTLLTGAWMEQLIIVLGHLPAALPGIDRPDADQARAVLTGVSDPGARSLWAHYLLGALLVYGLLPRAILAAGFGWRWNRTRLPLDLGRPGYLAVLPALTGSGSESDPAFGPAPPATDGVETLLPPALPGAGTPVRIGIELDRWPPDSTHQPVFGRADDRQQRRELQQRLGRLDPRPEKIIALCSMLRSPDRGTGRWLAELRTIAPVEIQAVEAGTRQDDRTPDADLAARIQDWQALARRFGLGFIDAP